MPAASFSAVSTMRVLAASASASLVSRAAFRSSRSFSSAGAKRVEPDQQAVEVAQRGGAVDLLPHRLDGALGVVRAQGAARQPLLQQIDFDLEPSNRLAYSAIASAGSPPGHWPIWRSPSAVRRYTVPSSVDASPRACCAASGELMPHSLGISAPID